MRRKRALRQLRTGRVRLRGEPASGPGGEDHVPRRETKLPGGALIRAQGLADHMFVLRRVHAARRVDDALNSGDCAGVALELDASYEM